MTIEKAREILQEEIADFTNEEVLGLIADIGRVCDGILDVIANRDLTVIKRKN